MLERNVQMFSLMAQLMRHSNNHNEASSRFSQLLETQSQLMHEINHMANGSHKPACKICGDIGHTHTEHKDQCPNCDAHHPNSQCPTSLVTCFLCEGIDHVPAKCSLYPIVQQMNQDRVQQALEKTRGGTMPIKRDTPQQTVQIITHAPRCNYRKRKHDAARHYKKPEEISEIEIDYTEQELNDLLALEKPKKNKCKNQKINVPSYTRNPKPSKALVKKDLSQITCWRCKKTGHYADKCSQRETEVIAKPLPVLRDLSEVTCFNCKELGHYADKCPKKHQDATK